MRHVGVVGVRGSPADLSSPPRTCPWWLNWTFNHVAHHPIMAEKKNSLPRCTRTGTRVTCPAKPMTKERMIKLAAKLGLSGGPYESHDNG